MLFGHLKKKFANLSFRGKKSQLNFVKSYCYIQMQVTYITKYLRLKNSGKAKGSKTDLGTDMKE